MCDEPKALVPEGAKCNRWDQERKERTKYMLEVMQAFIEGKKIQYRRSAGIGDWLEANTPIWNWEDADYRVKPIEGLPVIKWSSVPEDFTYFAVDPDGGQYFYNHKPVLRGHKWFCDDTVSGVKYIQVYGIEYTCDPSESLVKRPA